MRKNKFEIPTIVIVLIILFVLILFIASLGYLSPKEIGKLPNEFKDTKEEAKRKHKRLAEHIEKQEVLKEKLDRKFKRTYFLVRLGLMILWFAVLSVFCFLGFINNLGDVLNCSETSILILIVLNFLTFGTITNLKNYIDLIKTKTENWIFGKYVTINDKIEANKIELNKLSSDLTSNLPTIGIKDQLQ
jgi:hypothetical protein